MSRNRSLKGLWTDTDGFIIPYVTVLLVVIIGVSVLALDGARYVSLQSQLQHGADQLALAAAAELDATSDACCIAGGGRAENALTTTLASFQQSTLFGTGADQYVRIQSVRFLSALPASDRTFPIPDSLVTTDPLQAHFVEVMVTPVTIPTILPAAFFGGATFPTQATAVAGFSKNVCQTTPMYVCNPYEPVGNTDYAAATALLTNPPESEGDPLDPNALLHRRMFSLRYSPGNFDQPGNYGFLQSPFAGGLNGVRQGVAGVSPKTCFNASSVDTEPGFFAEAIARAFNVRFDIYGGPLNQNNPDYAPSLNVRKGYVGAACSQTPSAPPQAMGLPPDLPMVSPPPSIGTGSWQFEQYWSTEHTCGASCPPQQVNGAPASNTNLPSRYSVYKHEIELGANPGGLGDASLGGEVGRPVCSSRVPPVNVDRRIIINAILNCQALSQPGGPLNGGKSRDIPVAAFGKYFLLHPVDPSTGSADTEFVGLVPDSERPFAAPNTVQLYR